MFLRKKPNKSGTVSVQIIDKSSGKYVVKETVGSSSDEVELSFLMKKGRHRIAALTAQSTIAFDKAAELEFVDTFLHHLDSFSLVGPELYCFDLIFLQLIQVAVNTINT